MGKVSLLNPEPLYVQLKNDLKREIIEQRLKPGDRLWSEKELVERTGVSTITVRKALAELCKEGWLYKRQGMGSYVAERNLSSNSLNDQAGKNIALIICNRTFIDAFYSRVLHGVERVTYENGYRLIYRSIMTEGIDRNFQLEKEVLPDKSDLVGLIITGPIPPWIVTAVNRDLIPCVFVGDIAQKRITTKKIRLLAFDNYGMAFDGANYLISLGHRKVGFLTGPLRFCWWIQMYNGYRDALKKAQIPINKKLVLECDFDTVNYGYAAMKEMLSNVPTPTAILATNDLLAVGAMKAIKEKGMEIPEDISIVGMGDYEIGRYYEPHLTTIGCNVENLGERAVKILTRSIGVDSPSRMIFPHQLVVRQSCQKVNG